MILVGLGLSGPLTLLIALCQFASPHIFLSTATGIAFSARAIGGAFGSAVLNVIIAAKLSNYGNAVAGAAIKAGLPASSAGDLLTAMASGSAALFAAVDGLNDKILGAAMSASEWQYAHAYRVAWASLIPFIVLAILAVWFTKSVKDLMTDHIEATVEHTPVHHEEKGQVTA